MYMKKDETTSENDETMKFLVKTNLINVNMIEFRWNPKSLSATSTIDQI